MSKRDRKRTQGFSLIELMITTAILGIIVSIATPRYYAYVRHSRLAEATTFLSMVRRYQYTYYSTYDCFVSVQRTPLAGFPPGALPRVWDSAFTNPPIPCPGPGTDFSFNDLNAIPHGRQGYFFYECESRTSPPDITCNALSDLDSDGSIAERIFCTDTANTGVCIASGTGQVSLFPFEIIRVSAGKY